MPPPRRPIRARRGGGFASPGLPAPQLPPERRPSIYQSGLRLCKVQRGIRTTISVGFALTHASVPPSSSGFRLSACVMTQGSPSAARSTPLNILAVFAGLSPLLIVWLIYAIMKIAYVVTGGTFPGPEWL